MILTRDVDLGGPLPAAPDAVARAIADGLRGNGCVIRHVAPDVVEFSGPGVLSSTPRKSDEAATVVSSGILWLDPAGGRVRMTLRIHPLHFLVAVVPAGFALAPDVTPLGRLLFVAVAVVLLCVNLVMARSVFERWVTEGARRA